jgi:hypothetical protein
MRLLSSLALLSVLTACNPAFAQEPPKGSCVSADLLIDEAHKDGAKAAAFTGMATKQFLTLVEVTGVPPAMSYIVAFTREDIPTVLVVAFGPTNCALTYVTIKKGEYDKALEIISGRPS